MEGREHDIYYYRNQTVCKCVSCWVYVRLSPQFLCGPEVTVGQQGVQLIRKAGREVGENTDHWNPCLSLKLPQHHGRGGPVEAAACFTSGLTHPPKVDDTEEEVAAASAGHHLVLPCATR